MKKHAKNYLLKILKKNKEIGKKLFQTTAIELLIKLNLMSYSNFVVRNRHILIKNAAEFDFDFLQIHQ